MPAQTAQPHLHPPTTTPTQNTGIAPVTGHSSVPSLEQEMHRPYFPLFLGGKPSSPQKPLPSMLRNSVACSAPLGGHHNLASLPGFNNSIPSFNPLTGPASMVPTSGLLPVTSLVRNANLERHNATFSAEKLYFDALKVKAHAALQQRISAGRSAGLLI